MAWITPTWESLYQVLSAAEIEVLGSLQKYPGDKLTTDQGELLVTDQGNTLVTDPPYDNLLSPVISRTVAMVRGYIDASGRYTLGESGTIPESLESTMLDVAVVEAWKRLGGDMLDLNDRRSAAYDDAMERLRSVARGEFGIAEPETPTTEDSQGFDFAGDSVDKDFAL